MKNFIINDNTFPDIVGLIITHKDLDKFTVQSYYKSNLSEVIHYRDYSDLTSTLATLCSDKNFTVIPTSAVTIKEAISLHPELLI